MSPIFVSRIYQRAELAAAVAAQRAENAANSQRLVAATSQLDELQRASKTYQRQISTSQQQIVDGSAWNDQAHTKLQLASLRNAPLYQQLAAATRLREQAQARLKQVCTH